MTLRVPTLRLAVVALTALAMLLTALTVGAVARPYVLTKGHIDALSPTIEDGELKLRLSDDSRIYTTEGHVIRDVDQVLLNLHDGAKETLASAPPSSYAFLGLGAGDSHWAVDFSGANQSSVIWPGWDTQHESVNGKVDELAPNQYFRVGLVQAVRPSGGGVHIYAPEFGGAPRIFASTTEGAWNGAQWPNVTGPNAWSLFHQHQHAAWSFTKPGLHQLTFAVDAKKDGQPLSASADYLFYVGDLPNPTADNGGLPTLTLGGLEDHYEVGEQISLTTSQSPATGEDHYHWYTRCGDRSPWQTLSGALSAGHSLPATAELDGCLIQARLFDHDHGLVALTTPAELHVHDHGGEPGTATTLTIEGLKAHYHPGDVATLVVKQDPNTGEDHWHWFLKCGDNPWTVVAGQATSTLTLPLELRHHGCLVQAKLYDHDHEVIAESAPVTLAVEDHGSHEPQPQPQPDPTPQPQPQPGPSPDPPADAKPARVGLTVTKPKQAVRSGSLRRAGSVAVRYRTNVAARVRTTVRISARDARRIGLRVGRGAKQLTIGTATRQVKRAGTGTLRVRLTAAQRKALARVRGTLRLRVTTTASAAGRTTASRTTVLQVRR